MKNTGDTARADLQHLVALRALAPQLPAAQRRILDGIAADLERRIGPVIPKRRAAAILGISAQALDEWIRRGRIDAADRPGTSRTGVATASVVWTANQSPPGTTRPGRVVDRARERAAFWRFNAEVTAADARAFAALPLARRVAHLDAINRTMDALGAIRLRPQDGDAMAHGS